MPRITSGKLKNRKINCPEGLSVRPSLEKTRAMIFNVLNSRFELKNFTAIDLFSGSGALGIEALSQGVKEVILIEKDGEIFKNLKDNVKSLGIQDETRLLHKDTLTWLKAAPLLAGPCLFLLDPPYNQGLAEQAIGLIAELNIKEAIIVAERGKTEELPCPLHFTNFKQKKIGRSLVDFYSTP